VLGDRSPCKRTVGSNPTPSAPVVTVSGVPIGWLRGNIDELRRGRAIERRRAQEERRFRQAVADGRAVRGVQRCPSQASAPAGAPRMDRWSASAQDSECGSTSTVMTAATTTYCWSMATDNAGVA